MPLLPEAPTLRPRNRSLHTVYARVLTEGRFVPGQKGLRFVLPPEGRLEGVVVRKATGQPIADVSLHASGSALSGMQQVSAKTDKDGRFALSGLSAGKYDVTIVGTGRALPEWIGGCENVPVENGKAASVMIEAFEGGVLELALKDSAAGTPIAGQAIVTICPADDRRRSRSAVSLAGVASVRLPAGRYIVPDVRKAGYSYAAAKGEPFVVEVGKTQHAALSLSPAPRLVVTVKNLLGWTVAGAKARVIPLIGPSKDLTSGADGKLEIPAEDIGMMLYLLHVRHPRQNLSTIAPMAKGEAPLVVTLRPPLQVTGAVTDAQGHPLPGVPVEAKVEFPHLGRFSVIAEATSDERGRYRLELPGAMCYALTARSPGRIPAETLVSDTDLARGEHTLKDLVLRPADRTVRGIVKDAQGRPVPGAVVSVGRPLYQTAASAVVTDARGLFILEHMGEEPELRVWVRVPGRGWIGDEAPKPGDNDVTVIVAPSHGD